MKIYIVVQEVQNEHGYVDTTAMEAFTTPELASKCIKDYEDSDLEEGERPAGRDDEWQGDEDDWTTSYRVEIVELYREPRTSVESQVYIDTGNSPVVQEVR